MSVIYTIEGYFCKLKLVDDWKSNSEYGVMTLTPENLIFEISFKKELNNRFNKGSNLIIPYSEIIDIKKLKIRSNIIVIIEMIDGKNYAFILTTSKKCVNELYQTLSQTFFFEYKQQLT
jgi:hypothetical protein